MFQNAPQVSSDRTVPASVTKHARIVIMWMVFVTKDVILAGREATAKKVIFIFYLFYRAVNGIDKNKSETDEINNKRPLVHIVHLRNQFN